MGTGDVILLHLLGVKGDHMTQFTGTADASVLRSNPLIVNHYHRSIAPPDHGSLAGKSYFGTYQILSFDNRKHIYNHMAKIKTT